MNQCQRIFFKKHSMSLLQQQQQTAHSSSSPLNKIPFLQRVFKFTCTQSLRIVELASVNSIFSETIKEFETGAIVWRSNFLKEDSVWAPKPEQVETAKMQSNNNDTANTIDTTDPEETETDTDTYTDDTTDSDEILGKSGYTTAGRTRPARRRTTRPRNQTNNNKPKPKINNTVNYCAPFAAAVAVSSHQLTPPTPLEEKGSNSRLDLIFRRAVIHEIVWVIDQLCQAGLKQTSSGVEKVSENNHDQRGMYPIQLAVVLGRMESLKTLFKYSRQLVPHEDGGYIDANPNNSFSGKTTLHHVASNYHSLDVVKHYCEELLKVKDALDVNASLFLPPPPQNNTNTASLTRYNTTLATTNMQPLTNLVKSQPSQKMSDLLSYFVRLPGINLDCEDSTDSFHSPLSYCARTRKIGFLKILLKAGADPNYQSKLQPRSVQRTPLHSCVEHDVESDYEITKILLANGANPDLQESHGFTPMHLAAQLPRRRFIEIMLAAKDKHGAIKNADVSVMDSAGQTARDFLVARIKHDGDEYSKCAKMIPASKNDKKSFASSSSNKSRSLW